MKERPIIFSGDRIPSLLSGKKTQTRRLTTPSRFPYGSVMDRLWVKEKCICFGHERTTETGQYRWPIFLNCNDRAREWFDANCVYAADLAHDDPRWIEPHGTLSSLYMPRWASRVTLEITAIRREKLQEISEADARAEGSEDSHCFAVRWNEIHGPGAWADNPLVWAITFKVI